MASNVKCQKYKKSGEFANISHIREVIYGAIKKYDEREITRTDLLTLLTSMECYAMVDVYESTPSHTQSNIDMKAYVRFKNDGTAQFLSDEPVEDRWKSIFDKVENEFPRPERRDNRVKGE